jgi:cytosine/uracil/thiamine/allantoin permease
MLYTAFMNSKPNVPGDIFMGEKEYSWRKDWNVNGWLFVATIISALCDVMFPQVTRQWPLGWRIGVVCAEFAAIALWARALTVWIRGMDEMHRRITISAVLFAVSATFFFAMLWHRLDHAGLFAAIFPKPKNGGGWDICTVGHEFLLLTLFYFVGHGIFNRRYK